MIQSTPGQGSEEEGESPEEGAAEGKAAVLIALTALTPAFNVERRMRITPTSGFVDVRRLPLYSLPRSQPRHLLPRRKTGRVPTEEVAIGEETCHRLLPTRAIRSSR